MPNCANRVALDVDVLDLRRSVRVEVHGQDLQTVLAGVQCEVETSRTGATVGEPRPHTVGLPVGIDLGTHPVAGRIERVPA